MRPRYTAVILTFVDPRQKLAHCFANCPHNYWQKMLTGPRRELEWGRGKLSKIWLAGYTTSRSKYECGGKKALINSGTKHRKWKLVKCSQNFDAAYFFPYNGTESEATNSIAFRQKFTKSWHGLGNPKLGENFSLDFHGAQMWCHGQIGLHDDMWFVTNK